MKSRWTALAVISLLLPCTATEALAVGARPLYPNLTHDVQFDGIATLTNMKHVIVPGLHFEVDRSSVGQNSPTAKTYARPHQMPVEMELTAANVVQLAGLISDCSAARPRVFMAQMHTRLGDPAVPEWTDFDQCQVARVLFPELGTGDRRGVALEFLPTIARLAATPRTMNAGTPDPGDPTLLTTSSFDCTITGIDSRLIRRVSAIEIKGDVARVRAPGLSDDAGATSRGVTTNGNFTMRVFGSTAAGLQAWQNALVNGQVSEREVSIRYLHPVTGAVLFTLRGSGVGLVALRPQRDDENGIPAYEAEFYVEYWTVLPPTEKPVKLEIAAPALTLPVQATGKK